MDVPGVRCWSVLPPTSLAGRGGHCGFHALPGHGACVASSERTAGRSQGCAAPWWLWPSQGLISLGALWGLVGPTPAHSTRSLALRGLAVTSVHPALRAWGAPVAPRVFSLAAIFLSALCLIRLPAWSTSLALNAMGPAWPSCMRCFRSLRATNPAPRPLDLHTRLGTFR